MLSLDKETFSYWITHPDDLTPTDFVQLQESLQTYPYCQALHTLLAKAASVHQKSQTVPFVRQAAAHALSRNALRRLIDNEFQWSENLLSRLNELSARHVPIPDDYQRESYALFKARKGLGSDFPTLQLLHLPPATSTQAEALPQPDESTLAETTLQNDLVHLTETPPISTTDQDQQRQMELIESFIKNEPSISRIRARPPKPSESTEQEDLSKRGQSTGGGLTTESFARILEKQGKFDKAREIYEKLMVKNPEKSAYFAAKIAELNAKRNVSDS